MRVRPLALGACVCLALNLCACAPSAGVIGGPDGPTVLISAAPDQTPATSAALGEATPEIPEAPTEAPASEAPHSETPASETPPLCGYPPAPAPSEPEAIPPSEMPSEAPIAEPSPEALATAAALYAQWRDGVQPAPDLADMSAYLDAYYDLDGSELESFVFYQPDMSGTLQEVFLAKAKPGQAGTVQAACQGRLEALQEEAAFYTGTGNYVDAAVLETAGDWVLLAACPDSARLAQLLREAAN